MAAAPKRKPTFIQSSRSISAEEKAIYHNTAGAGKSRVIREFFDLNDSDVALIEQRLEGHIEGVLDGRR